MKEEFDEYVEAKNDLAAIEATSQRMCVTIYRGSGSVNGWLVEDRDAIHFILVGLHAHVSSMRETARRAASEVLSAIEREPFPPTSAAAPHSSSTPPAVAPLSPETPKEVR